MGRMRAASLVVLLLAASVAAIADRWRSEARARHALGAARGRRPAHAHDRLGLRLPRALAAFGTGVVLALAGVLMQALLRNPAGRSLRPRRVGRRRRRRARAHACRRDGPRDRRRGRGRRVRRDAAGVRGRARRGRLDHDPAPVDGRRRGRRLRRDREPPALALGRLAPARNAVLAARRLRLRADTVVAARRSRSWRSRPASSRRGRSTR